MFYTENKTVHMFTIFLSLRILLRIWNLNTNCWHSNFLCNTECIGMNTILTKYPCDNNIVCHLCDKMLYVTCFRYEYFQYICSIHVKFYFELILIPLYGLYSIVIFKDVNFLFWCQKIIKISSILFNLDNLQ